MKALAILAMLAAMTAHAQAQEGYASVYGNENGQARRADGHLYNPLVIGCAHRSLLLGSLHRITNLRNGRVILCPVNDRGPYVAGRILDLSIGAARALGAGGLTRVRIE